MAISTSGVNWANPYSVANRDNFFNSYYSASGTGTSSTAYGTNQSSLNSATQSFLVNAKSSASSLLGTLSSLKSGAAFNEKTAVSSDKDVLSVKSVSSQYAKDMSDITVNVEQVAAAQKNGGVEKAASGKISASDAGTKYFEIETASGKSVISVKVNSGDTNEAVQKKMAEAINSKNLGITAKVSVADGKSVLSVESNATGVKTAGKDNFTIRSMSAGGTVGGSSIAEWAGITQVSQKAQDAVYSINGGAVKTGKSNDIDLGNGVTATLKQAGEAKVSLGKDDKSGINAVREMVNGFNELLEAVEKNKDDKKTSYLYNQLKQLSKTYEKSLKDIGISASSDGYLKIDEDAMKKAAESGKLENFFKNDGINYGFSTRLEKLASDVNRDPSRHITQSNARSNSSLDYLQEYRYSQIVNQGMLFDSFF